MDVSGGIVSYFPFISIVAMCLVEMSFCLEAVVSDSVDVDVDVRVFWANSCMSK